MLFLGNILKTESIHQKQVLPLKRQINSQQKWTHLDILRSKNSLKCKLELRKIETARIISHLLKDSNNKVILDANSLYMNLPPLGVDVRKEKH